VFSFALEAPELAPLTRWSTVERMMKKIRKILLPVFSLLISSSVFSEQSPFILDGNHLNNWLQTGQHRPVAEPTNSKFSQKDSEVTDPRVRIHQEGILDISGETITPVRIAVKAGPVAVVGSVELSMRTETNSRWFFRAENIGPEVNIWDAKGRAVLIPGNVTCQVLHRASLNDYRQAGLTLTADTPVFSYSSGTNGEKMRSDFFEDEDICPVGEVPAFTTQKDIEKKCKQCLGAVIQTLKEDVKARLSSLSYSVNTPICTVDAQCTSQDTDWSRGRCVLVKDQNDSMFSECRARSSVGGACPGKGSRGLFEYACDHGLACVKTQSAKGYFDYNRYECRDPKNWKFKGPLARTGKF